MSNRGRKRHVEDPSKIQNRLRIGLYNDGVDEEEGREERA